MSCAQNGRRSAERPDQSGERGCLDYRTSRRTGLVAAAALLASTRVRSVRGSDSATVVGTHELSLRACPTHECEVVATAPLGAVVTLIEDVGGEFVRIEHNGSDSYASSLYLAADPTVVPYLSEGAAGCHRVALIFNIGIGDEPVAEILDLLAAEGVPATMFPMGWWAEQHPSILARMVDEGYPIGSHGYAPTELTMRSYEGVLEDLHAATAAIEHATGAPIDRLFTAYAAATDDRIRSIVAAEGFLPVQWKVPAGDYGADATAEAVYSRVVDNVYDGAIVEFHLDGPASRVSTGVALPWILGALRWEGYHFVTIPEMTLDCH